MRFNVSRLDIQCWVSFGTRIPADHSPVYLEVTGYLGDSPTGFYLESEFCAKKMRLLIHSARQVVTITKEDVSYLSGQSMKSVEVLENNNDNVAIAIDE
jgi:hypothetical protein